MEISGNSHLVCFECRRSKKMAKNQTISQKCAECGTAMHNMGKLFTTPRRRDNAQWRKIEILIANGWKGYDWPVSPKMLLRDTEVVLRAEYERDVAAHVASCKEEGVERRKKLARVRFRKAKTTLKQNRLEEERQRLYQEQVLRQVTKLKREQSD